MQMPDTQIAVTLYNLRNHCTTEADFARTLERICEMGYKSVQLSGVALPVETVKKYFDSFGLYCCATHENTATISGDPKALIGKLQTLECDFTALGHPGQIDFTSLQAVTDLAEMFKRQGDILGEAGIKLGYHNHAIEFSKTRENGKTMLRNFYDMTAGHNVWAELDVHWVTRGGGSPSRWIRDLAGRISVIHFKDFAFVDNEPRFCEIGMGNLDWEDIIAACNETNVRWFSIEQDAEFPGRDIFESVKISYDNLKAMGVK